MKPTIITATAVPDPAGSLVYSGPSGVSMDEPRIDLLAKALAGAELNYRDAYERLGAGHSETGRRWDHMRRAGDAIRDHFAEKE